jgi:filamentous hemagglutinin family protein
MARTQSGQWPLKLICAALTACFTQAAVAMPNAPAVVNGSATFSQTGNALTVTNTDRAIINWNTFSIGSNESVRFIQPSASSSVMNRVLAADPSVLLGSLQSNGKVFLFNPAGITVGAGARIDVAGFIASTMTLSNEDFLANRLNFVATPGAGSVKVENGAEITTASGGQVYLIAPQVENSGLISTPQGEIILTAGQQVEIMDSGTPGVRVAVTSGGQALNVGQLMAESGRIGMVGAVVRQQGTVSADSIVREGGRIFLKATQSAELAAGSVTSANGTRGGSVQVESDAQTLVSGTVSATGSSATGGRVELLGDKVGVFDGATVDASGDTGGGTILIGGDYQGSNPGIRNAQLSFLGGGATLRADARTYGNGGKVIVWADDTTRAYGSISARGGSMGGNGGFVEVSGKRSLDFAATVDTSAPLGQTGTLLLDPNSVTIYDGPATPIGGASWTESGGGSTLQWSTIDAQLQSTNVTITTSDSGGAGDDIIFSNAYGPMNASATATQTLTLNANDKIVFNQNVDLKGGLQATAGSDIDVNASVKSAGSQTINAGGNINISAGATNAAGFEMANAAGSQTVSATGSLNLSGGTGAGTGAYLKSVGSQTVSAAAITLAAGNSFTSNSAIIDALGTQSVTTTSGDLTLSGSTDAKSEISTTGSQTINVAGNTSLTGGAGASAGAAMITAPTQNITIGGNLTMNAGTGSVVDSYGMAAAAAIGYDNGADVNLDVTGTISLNGNNATNQAVIGAAVGTANVDISANAITTTAYTSIGNWDGSMGGSVDLVATSGAISLPANSTLRTGTLVANAGSSLSILGTNFVDNVDLTATGPVTYRTAISGTTHITSVNTAGNIAIYGDVGSGTVALGAVTTTGGSTILVESQKAILDDNGSGVANVSTGTGNITLTSLTGTAVPGELAISTDVATSGALTATVNGGPNGSIAIRDVGANQVGSATINASLATTQGNVDYFRYGNLSLTGIAMSQRGSDNYRIGASGDVIVPAGNLFGSGAGLATLSAGGNLTVSAGSLTMRGNDNAISAGGTLTVGNSIDTDPGRALSVTAGAIQISGGTLTADGDLKVNTPGSLNITSGGTLSSAAGSLDFIVDGPMNITQGSVSAGLGIIGDANDGLTLGAAAGGTGTINAANGVVDLAIGNSGIAMYNGSYINSTDASQPAGGLIELNFPGLSAGGSMIDGVATFDGGYKIGGTLTTLGSGLEVTYGILTNPVSDAIVAAMNSSSSSGGGTSETSGSLVLVGTSSGTSPTTTIDGTQTVGGTEGTFGGTETTTTTENSSTTGSTQETQNAKKKPAQCSA